MARTFAGSDAPDVSIVVPARDEEQTLPALLDSLQAQTLPPAEILVIDAGSTDRTPDVVRGRADPRTRLVSVGPALPGAARNSGLAQARCDWVALLDAGCVAEPGWLAALVEPLSSSPPPAVVFGDYEPNLDSEWAVAQSLVIVPPRSPQTGARPSSTASMLVRREVWEAAGRFREDLRAAEDLLFFEALTRQGIATRTAPGARVRWNLAPGPRAFFRRLLRYSSDHLAAGLFHTWHRRVVAMDLLFISTVVAGVASPPVIALAPALGAARIARTVLRRTDNVKPRNPWRPDRLLRVAWLVALADLAVWGGLLRHIGRKTP